MIVYSKQILQKIGEIKLIIKKILSQEMHLKVHKERFYHEKTRASYPISVVIFDHREMLGYFNPEFYEMGFHCQLLYGSKEDLIDVIRHELAHYITYLEYGNSALAHGKEFKDFCSKMGWSKEIAKSEMVLQQEKSAILRRVEKLISLASSSNKNEAEVAMLKSRELLLKHNIEEFSVADEEKVYVSRVLSQKKESAKMRAIGKILETFFVSTVYHKGNGCIYLEVLGTQVNVEVAEYVSAFLERELDILWNEVKKQEDLKGLRSKNAFFLGLAKGYVEKTKTLVVYDEKALILIDAKLEKAKAIVYPRLSFSRSKNRGCSRSYHAGKEKGKALTIRPAVEAFVSKWLLVKK